MIINILTKDNKGSFSRSEGYVIIDIPLLYKVKVIKDGDEFTTEMNVSLINLKPLPDPILRCFKRNSVTMINYACKEASRIIKHDKEVDNFNFGVINNTKFIGSNKVKNGDRVTFIDSLGSVCSGVVKKDKYVISDNVKFPLSNILVIE